VFLVNSHNRHFTATARSSWGKPTHHQRHTFSRSYGVNLPSSLTRVLSRALGYSPRPPESVYSTITKEAPHAAFLGSVGLPSVPLKERTSSPLGLVNHRLSLSGPSDSAYGLEHGIHAPCLATLLRPRLLQRYPWWCRNINLLSIAYASRPRLRYRLTRGRIILPQETLGLRRQGFSP
jgi:hypothetical protein